LKSIGTIPVPQPGAGNRCGAASITGGED